MIDHDAVARAAEQSDKHPRSLRRVGEMVNRDMVMFEKGGTSRINLF